MLWEDIEKQFDIDIPEDEPVYPLNVACALLHMQYWTLHEILKEGIITPAKKSKNKTLFSHKDIKRLNYIKYLIDEKGVNIKGVKVIIEMKE